MYPEAQAQAEDSVGAAGAIASQLPPDAAAGVLATTGEAFTDAMGIGLLVAAVLAAAMAVVVVRYLPSRGSVAEPAEAEPVMRTLPEPERAL